MPSYFGLSMLLNKKFKYNKNLNFDDDEVLLNISKNISNLKKFYQHPYWKF